MKNRIVLVGVLTCVFLNCAGAMRAQAPVDASTPEAPVAPMNIAFRYGPQYFEQSLEDDPRYSRIGAMVDQGRCDIVLLDKTMNREAFYSTLNRKVDALAANGMDAYTTAIDFAAFSTAASHPVFQIHFRDQFGQEITWHFIVGEMVPHASPEVIFRTDSSGITFLYAPRRAAGIAGTSLTIGGRKHLPGSAQPNGALAAFYATDMTAGRILPGTDLWSVERSPADIYPMATWNLTAAGGQQRILAVKQRSDREAAVEQVDLNSPDALQVVLTVVRINGAYGLASLSFETHGNRLWIFFSPALPLPAHQVDDKTTVTFTINENEQANVASGELEVQRAVDAEHLFWRFETPSLARGVFFETGVNLIPSGGEQASCVNEGCSVPSNKQR